MKPEDPSDSNESLLKPHKTWTSRTTLMVVSDLIVKPVLALFIVASLLFVGWRILPSNPLYLFIFPGMDASTINHVINLWGFNLPLPTQYGIFLVNIFTGTMYNTISFATLGPVGGMIAARFPNTLLLILVPFLIVAVIFTLYYWKRKDSCNETSGWRRYLYLLLFSKSFWIFLGLASYAVIFTLMILGVLPPGFVQSYPIPTNPIVFVLDLGWHLIGPATLIALFSMAVATHYFYQQPEQPMPPLSHGLSRLLLWTVTISLPIEMLFMWYGTGRLLFYSLFFYDFPVLFITALTYILTFGLAAVLLEGILRWGIYRNPVELHGQTVIPAQKSTFRRTTVLAGFTLLFILIGVAVVGDLLFSGPWIWPPDPFQSSLATLFPLLVDGFSIGFVATLIGGFIGLVAYRVLRMHLKWSINYILAFLVSLLVVTLFIQPLLPTILLNLFLSTPWIAALILSVGVIRKISNSQLGEGSASVANWGQTLLPLFILYSLVGILLALVLGFMGVGFSQNFGAVIWGLLDLGFTVETLIALVIPSVIIIYIVVTFEVLWSGLQCSRIDEPSK